MKKILQIIFIITLNVSTFNCLAYTIPSNNKCDTTINNGQSEENINNFQNKINNDLNLLSIFIILFIIIVFFIVNLFNNYYKV